MNARHSSSGTDRSQATPVSPAASGGRRPAGQILVLFVMAIFVITGVVAIVIDVSWYWASSLRVQRAADAAALAGVVWLPGDPTSAYSTARTEASKNGYTNGGAVTVDAIKDPQNDRRLNVTITTPVNTYFMRILGMSSIQASRTARAEFILPVPMGSPQQWYGVGSFEWMAPGPVTPNGPKTPTVTATPNGWTNPNNGRVSDNSYATNNAGGQQGYGNFAFAVPAGATIVGIEVRVEAKSSDAAGCEIGVALSGDNGASYGTQKTVALTGADPASPYSLLGSSSDLWGGTWTDTKFGNGLFRLRVSELDPGAACVDSATTSLDSLSATAYYRVPGGIAPMAVPTPAGETVAPTSQGFWGAVITKGGARRNGDRFSPYRVYGSQATLNAEYDANGYDYTVELKAGTSNGRVWLFDPTFCATATNPNGSGNFGAGDHWTEQPTGTVDMSPVTTEYRLYWNNNTPYEPLDDVLVGTPLIYNNERQSDQSGNFGTVPTVTPGGIAISDCRANPAHNTWVSLANGLNPGMYRLNVKVSSPNNDATAAENLWSIYVGAAGPAGNARVYGGGRMAAYSNLNGAAAYQSFYLAQIDAVHAGKTLIIELFDPGDVAGNAKLRIKSPNGSAYNNATFSYTSDANCVAGTSDACSAANRTYIQTAISGSGSSFDNTVITISIPLPASYGSGGLQPPGEPESGWWKIEYEVGAANDTTTWQVSIRGNPVHLVVP
jgi:hypothetical protein